KLLSLGTSRQIGIDRPLANLSKLLASPLADTAIRMQLSFAVGIHSKGPTVTSVDSGRISGAESRGVLIVIQPSGWSRLVSELFWNAFTTTDLAVVAPRFLILT